MPKLARKYNPESGRHTERRETLGESEQVKGLIREGDNTKLYILPTLPNVQKYSLQA